MKKLIFYPLLFILFFLFSSCDKGREIPVISSLRISLSKVQILGDGVDSALITILNQDGVDVNRFVTIYFDDKIYKGLTFRYTSPIVSKIYASFEQIKSNEIEVEVVEDKNMKFEKNVLLEQYTGTWCGWCPRAINQINNLKKIDKQIAHAALHLDDEFSFSLTGLLFQSFGFTGVPTVHADRTIEWEGNQGIISSMHAPVRAGLCINVSGNSSLITAKIRIKFGINYSENIKMTVYLVHDSLVANQSNFYDTDPNSPYYRKGNPMYNFINKNVLIQTGTDLYGVTIPADSIGIGHTYTREFGFSNFRCENINNMKIIAFITYASGGKMNNVLNCIIAGVGENKDFVFIN